MATPLATTVVLSAERAGSVVNTLLDTAVPSLALSLHDESEEPLYAPPPLLTRMIGAGLPGRKPGAGTYERG
ncbi:hypothetical protein ACFQ6U_09655 [Streptomyces sp. NPDC056465]|uniref:hypothetical protein n=1 Tax=Streptomyces sp. NPDC056465 TaxID=3345829 RepID=UPI00368AA529